MRIYSPGFDQYADGTLKLKVLLAGGTGVGKTRMSSFFQDPFFIFCEPGVGSIVDRGTAVKAVNVNSSREMSDVLDHLTKLERLPWTDRPVKTVVVDTMDAYQSKLIIERLGPGKDAMEARDGDWGWLESKTTRLMTRLMGFDYHIVVLVHCKERFLKEGDAKVTVWEPLLKGELRNTLPAMFDLVGAVDWDWGAEDGERVQKRELTFTPSPAYPWLKDRFHVMPRKIPVDLTGPGTFETLMGALAAKAEQIPESTSEDVEVDGTPEGVGPLPGGPVKATKKATKAAKPAPAKDKEPEKQDAGAAVDPGHAGGTGAPAPVSHEQAVANVTEGLGAQVESEKPTTAADQRALLQSAQEARAAQATPESAPGTSEPAPVVCGTLAPPIPAVAFEGCGTAIGPTQPSARLSKLRHGRLFCSECLSRADAEMQSAKSA